MKGMLKVPKQEYIKYLREIEELSISEIKVWYMFISNLVYF